MLYSSLTDETAKGLMMKAKQILESIQPHFSKARIFDLINHAIGELDLKDTAQVAALLGVEKATIHKRAAYNKIGHLIAARARVYSPSDVARLRRIIFEYRGQRPETIEMVSKMRKMREGKHSLAAIGREFGISESYVSKLLARE